MKNEKDIALEFNEFSKNYTEDMIRCVPHYMDLVSSFTKNLPEDFKPEHILDLGCGNGNITAQFIPYFPDSNYTLVDASKEMIDLCQKQFQDYNVKYCNTYFKDFHFEEGHYDLIVAGFSLHHCSNNERQALFKKIYSALKKGGIFSYCDLMISKTNSDHPSLLKEWGGYVNSNFPDGEKWAWVMEHYKDYDNPTDYSLQFEWLKLAGFTNIQTPFKDGYWIYLQIQK
ncbi:class I SAM-dependent methyltransferase [Christiangramia echinicola]|uniref:Methyltransferase domain-containing protein n=1 Tax=Christiangramia echinicola TaxID=279359 RepID=A0A1H1MGX1_9FLAO|nr:class I SAM-dependent methyltransferase [Christiangramia echinicola]SDR85852.1 Methyltransferase domain-containing protein [Christiangramia echinicola]